MTGRCVQRRETSSGNGLPVKAPFAAVMNGVANSGGPGLV